jgi:cyclic pyranopterin phosphate synthase
MERHPETVKASDEENETAKTYTIPGHKGSFGFISSMSDHFCSSCNRLRITADGQIKVCTIKCSLSLHLMANLWNGQVCLFDPKEISLRDHLRTESDDSRLLEIIGDAVRGKKAKHAGMENIDVVQNRPMIKIGG